MAINPLDPKLVAVTDQGEASAAGGVDRTIAVWRAYEDRGWSHTQVLLGVVMGLQEGVVAAPFDRLVHDWAEQCDDDGIGCDLGMCARCAARRECAEELRETLATNDGTETIVSMLAVCIGRLADQQRAREAAAK